MPPPVGVGLGLSPPARTAVARDCRLCSPCRRRSCLGHRRAFLDPARRHDCRPSYPCHRPSRPGRFRSGLGPDLGQQRHRRFRARPGPDPSGRDRSVRDHPVLARSALGRWTLGRCWFGPGLDWRIRCDRGGRGCPGRGLGSCGRARGRNTSYRRCPPVVTSHPASPAPQVQRSRSAWLPPCDGS